MDSAWIGVIGVAVGVVVTFINGGIKIGKLQSDLENLKQRVQVHEPTAVQIATLSTQMTNLQQSLEKVEHNIDRLFERTNKRSGT